MNISFHHVFSVHHFGGSATNSIAHFSALLDFVVPPINLEVASSSRLARNAEKRTLEPVQLRFLGLFAPNLPPIVLEPVKNKKIRLLFSPYDKASSRQTKTDKPSFRT
jgi:hypothetical protein